MSIETEIDLQGMQEAGRVVALTLRQMIDYARPGMTTRELDEYGRELLSTYGATSAPQRDYDFPGATCISLNHEVCHGIPSENKVLQEGDLINIDVSAELHGYYGDNGCSFILGHDHRGLQPLVDASRQILYEAIRHIRGGVRIAEVGGIMEREALRRGYQEIRNICGHGIGRRLHEDPREIPCFRDRDNRERFRKNSVIALETFISTKARYVHESDDGWTLVTNDRSYVCQHEHTLIVTDDLPIILTRENGI